MNKKFEKKLGKSKDPIFKIKNVDFHALSQKIAQDLEQKSKKRREEEKERRKKATNSITKPKTLVPVTEKLEENQASPVSSTQLFKYNPKEESTPIYLLGHHEQREKRETNQIMSLVKQYYHIDLLEYFKLFVI